MVENSISGGGLANPGDDLNKNIFPQERCKWKNHPLLALLFSSARGTRSSCCCATTPTGAGTWAPPGGHLDFGETPEACAIREAREETGLALHAVRFLALTNDVFTAEDRHYITIWMEAVEYSGELSLNTPEEAAQFGWFAWDALPQALFLPFRNLLAGNSYPARSRWLQQ